jgi:hypothetical protein
MAMKQLKTFVGGSRERRKTSEANNKKLAFHPKNGISESKTFGIMKGQQKEMN